MYKKDKGLYNVYGNMLRENHLGGVPISIPAPNMLGGSSPVEDTRSDFNDIACRNIESIKENLDKLVEKLHSCDTADAWIYSKITLAADYINEVTEALYQDCGTEEHEVIFAIGSADAM